MTAEWTELNTLQDVAKAQADGWEIEYASVENEWLAWGGGAWMNGILYRGRPKQPKTRTVTSECWRHMRDGEVRWRDPESDWNFVSDWKRFPAGDFVGEVEE
jgi:hypothetical protein